MANKHAKMWMIIYMVTAVVIALVFTGCKTKVVTVEKVKIDTTYITKHQHDSIYVRDSIMVNQWQRGDTVYQVRDRWQTAWHDRWMHDTIYKSVVDSVPVPYPVVKEVQKPIPLWHFVVVGIALLVCVWQIKKIIKS